MLFQRTIPDFKPSPKSYALGVQVFEQMQACLAADGLRDPDHFDIWKALVGGLSAQQKPTILAVTGGFRLIDEMVDMYADHVLPAPTPRRRR